MIYILIPIQILEVDDKINNRKVFEIKGNIGALIICMVVLNTLLIGWNFGCVAINKDGGSNNTLDEGSELQPLSRSNGGINWSQIETISEPVPNQNLTIGNSIAPHIAVENDKIYVVWHDFNDTNGAGTDSDIFFRNFNGNIWCDIQVISEPVLGQDLNSRNSTRPEITVENGKIYVIWTDENNTDGAGTDHDIFFRCNLTGLGWEDIQVISEPVSGQNYNTGYSGGGNLAVDNDKIYVTWTDDNNTNGAGIEPDIFYKTNLTGNSWEPVQIISEPIPGFDTNIFASQGGKITVENGQVYVVWHDQNATNGAGTDPDIFYRCNLTGTSWEPVQVISEPVFGRNFDTLFSLLPIIEVHNGQIYVVWYDLNNTNGASSGSLDWDIFFRCNLTGSHWEPIQVISEPVYGKNFNNGSSYFGLDIAVENGIIFVAWSDDNNTNNAGTDRDILYRCNLTGLGWEDIEIVSEPIKGMNINTGGSTNPEIVAESGNIHVVWEDDNDTNGAGTDRDIFYRCKHVVTPSIFLRFPNLTPNWGNTSTEFNFSVIYYQLNNTPPTRMKAKIDDTEHSMLQVDSSDTNYTNGKKYYFKIKNLDIGTHTYEFNASDGENFTNSRLFSNLVVTNTLPQIITEDNLTAIEDQYYETNYEFKDMDIANVGQICYWEFETNASWLAFDTITATLLGTPTNDDVGKYWVNIIVNDTIDIVFTNFTLTVININDRPIITTNNVEFTYEDKLYKVDYNATDIDSPLEHQTWSLETSASSWLEIIPTSGILMGTPGNDDVGNYGVNISVDDGNNGRVWSNFTLTVIDTNDVPVIITEYVTTVYEDDLYSVNYEAIDIDDTLMFKWYLKTNASWLSIDDETGLLSGTPENDDIGFYSVNITVEDLRDGRNYQNFTLEVINVNDAPEWITILKDLEIPEGGRFVFDANATDVDSGDVLEFKISSTPATNITIGSKTGLIEWTASIEALGAPEYTLEVNISVSDGKATLWANFKITVLPNPRPTTKLTSPANNSRVSAIGLELTWTGYDDENESLTFVLYLSKDLSSVFNRLKSKRIISNTNKTSYLVQNLEGGSIYYWTVVPFDDLRHGTCQNDYYVFEVNTPPTISMVQPQKTTAGAKFKFELICQDTDEEDLVNLNYSLELVPEGMTINSTTGVLTWTPTKAQVGIHTIKVCVSDGIDQVNISFELEVIEKASRTSSNNIFAISTVSLLILLAGVGSFIGGTEIGKYKFLSIFFVPLYNRLHQDKVLDNYTRGQIHGYIKARPGEHYNAIKSALELKNGILAHHLRILEKEGYVVSKRDGFYTRFYPKGIKISEPDTLDRNLIHIIDTQPGITQSKIISLLNSSQQVVSYNLIKLTRDHILKLEPNGREKKYYINYDAADSYQDQYQDQFQTQSPVQSQQYTSGNEHAKYMAADSELKSKKI